MQGPGAQGDDKLTASGQGMATKVGSAGGKGWEGVAAKVGRVGLGVLPP